MGSNVNYFGPYSWFAGLVPYPTYGLHGGKDYFAGQVGGQYDPSIILGNGVDPLDNLYKGHDFGFFLADGFLDVDLNAYVDQMIYSNDLLLKGISELSFQSMKIDGMLYAGSSYTIFGLQSFFLDHFGRTIEWPSQSDPQRDSLSGLPSDIFSNFQSLTPFPAPFGFPDATATGGSIPYSWPLMLPLQNPISPQFNPQIDSATGGFIPYGGSLPPTFYMPPTLGEEGRWIVGSPNSMPYTGGIDGYPNSLIFGLGTPSGVEGITFAPPGFGSPTGVPGVNFYNSPNLFGPSYASSDLEGMLAQDYNPFQSYMLYEQLGTFGTDSSSAWSWAVDFTNPASFNLDPYTATGIAGVGYQFGTQAGIGGYMSDLSWAYTPTWTSNITFNPDSASGSLINFNDPSSFTWGYENLIGSGGGFDSWVPPISYDYVDYNFDYFDYYGGVFPVVLDLDGDGLEITPVSSSNMFFDMTGDGRQNRTAWAGAGDGVLVFDVDGDGQVTERNEVVFTDWDATARNDMQALAHVFDTDNDGSLDSGDDQFASFKVLVTNADGTTTLKTLTEAGITSINLIPDATRIVLPDGSTIDGQTTFARSGGGTGTAAAVTLMADMAGHIVEQTVTHNGDGSTTIASKALNPDGSVGYEIVGHTSADGNTRTLSVDGDGDGVIDKVQTIATVTNGDGSTTETLTNRNGADVLLDRTVTTTSADRKTISIGRDLTGDGLNDQTETRVTAVDGSTTITVSDLNPDGSLKGKTTSTTSANGLTRTVQSDLDGDADNDVTETDATVVNGDGSRSQTVSTTNKDGTLRDRSVTETSADGRAKTKSTDYNGDGVNDLLYACAIALLADGTSVSTETTTGNDGTLRDKTVTTLTADGLSRMTEVDITGDGLFDSTTADVTVVGADGSRTRTVSVFNLDGSLREKTVTVKEADGRSRTIQSDVTGDGAWDRIETVVVDSAGVTVDTLTEFDANGFYTSEVVTTTSADGLTVTTQSDLVGDANFDGTRTVTTVRNADGSSTVTETNESGDGTLLSKLVTATSADGLSRTIQRDSNGDGTFEVTATDITVVNPDTSRVQTVTERFTSGALKSKSVTTISADRKTVTIVDDRNGDGANDRQETIVTQANGTVVDTVSRFNPNGSLLDKSVTTTSANGLSVTTQFDENGDTVFDLTRTDVTVLNDDGGRTTTVTDKNANNSVRDQIVTTTSDDGLSATVKTDRNGDGVFELTRVSNTVLNADGSRTTTVDNKNANNSLRSEMITTSSTTGLSTTTETDLDGNGTFDRSLTDVVALNADGSRTRTVTEENGDGSLRSETITTTSADRRSITVTRDTNGDGNLDETQSTVTQADGSVVGTLVHLNPDGSVRDATTTTTSFDGTTLTTEVDLDGDGDVDTTTWHSLVLYPDGSTGEFLENYAGSTGSTLVNATWTFVSADGRSVTTQRDFDGDWVDDLITTDVTVINANGSQVRTVSNFSGDDTLLDSTITTTSADGRTITISSDTLGDFDATIFETLHKTVVVQADGKEVTTVTYPNTVYDTETDTRTRSANGLSSSTAITDPAADFDWINVSSVTTLNADGSRREVFNNPDPWGYDTTTTTSATGLSKTVQMSGAVNDFDPMLTMNATDVTVLNADGSTTQTITSAITQTTSNSTGGTSKSVTISSDDGLSTTVKLDVNNDGRFDRTDEKVAAVDGSTTETVTLLNYSTGALVQKDVLSTSFDGRSQSLQRDTNGDSVFDHFETTATNADGSITGTTWNTNASGSLLDRLVTTTSANGLSKSSTLDVNGDSVIDFSQTTITVLNADGSGTTFVSDFFGNGALRSRTVTTTSANGLSKSTEFDLNGDGVVDEYLDDVTTFYADGWREQVTTETYADGTLKSQTFNGIDARTYNSYEITEFDTNGDEVIDRDIQVWIDQDGYRTDVITYYNADGSQKAQVQNENGPDGLSQYIWYGGVAQEGFPNESFYFIPGSNGSYLWNRFTASIAQTATHTIDLGGVDHWVFANQSLSAYLSNPVFKTLRIDLVTEKKLIDMARRIYDTVLDRTMDQSEVQTLAGYISAAGLLDTTKLERFPLDMGHAKYPAWLK